MKERVGWSLFHRWVMNGLQRPVTQLGRLGSSPLLKKKHQRIGCHQGRQAPAGELPATAVKYLPTYPAYLHSTSAVPIYF